MDIAAISQKRYTTKVYDASRTIPEGEFKQLCTLLRNCPSSVNSQPWHFVVVQTVAGKAKILDSIADFNHGRVKDASHVVIFCAKTTMGDAHLEQLLEQEQKDGRFADEKARQGQNSGRRHFVGLNNQSPQDLLTWESKQIYLALGMLLLGAASLGIDATPIEGFNAGRLDEILGLSQKGLTSVVMASLGYRSAEDFNAGLPKSRLPEAQVFSRM